MRFCVVTPSLLRTDGQGRVNLEIVLEAIRQGHEVIVMAEGIDPAGSPGIVPVLMRQPDWLPGRLLRDQLFALRTSLYLYRNRGKFDAVLANGFVTWIRSDINIFHFVYKSWFSCSDHPWRVDRSVRSTYAGFYSLINIMLERHALAKAAKAVAISRSVAQDLVYMLRTKSAPEIISNGVDLDEFCPGPKDRSNFGLGENVTAALFAGDLKSPRKNLDTVLKALRLVPNLHLLVAGSHAETSAPESAALLGISDRVHFLGFRRDMPAVMRTADIFVFPSRYEPCGLVLLEALASGVPVITSRSAGLSDLIEATTGYVLEDCNDVQALATALAALASDAPRRQVMAQDARRSAERWSWRMMARRYVDLLEQAGGRSPLRANG